jgi:hypothetical protein
MPTRWADMSSLGRHFFRLLVLYTASLLQSNMTFCIMRQVGNNSLDV